MAVRLTLVMILALGAAAPVCTAQVSHRFGERQPQPRRPETIRIATYNVLNLFDHRDDPALKGDQDDMPQAKPIPECRELAKAIRAVDADIIALQEVESLEALQSFRDEFLADMGYEYMASIDVGYYRGVENAVLSRFPISGAKAPANARIDRVKRHGGGWADPPKENVPRTFQRTPLRCDITTPEGYELTLFNVHHKSGRSNRYHREGEALALVDRINTVARKDPGRNIVLLGDFNAAPWDRSMDVYRDAGFIDVMADPTRERHKTHESDRTLDFILLNSAAHRELVPGSAHVYGVKSPPKSFDWKNDKRPPEAPSDHYPVIIDLVPSDQP